MENVSADSRGVSRWFWGVLLLGVLVLSTVLRFQAIHWGLPTADRFTTFYIDEYTCLHVLSQMNPGDLQFNPHYFIDPTFFYYQVGIVLKLVAILGKVTLNSAQDYYLKNPIEYDRLFVVGRSLTAAYGVATTLLFYVLGREMSRSRAGGVLTAIFYAITPVAVITCHVIDVGVPVTFWIALAFLCFVEACRNPFTHRIPLFVGFLSAGLAFSTKYTAAPIFFSGFLALHLCGNNLRSYIGAALFSLLGFIVGTPYALFDLQGFWPQFHNAMGQASHSLPTISWQHFIYPFYHYPYAVGIVLSVVCVIGLVAATSEKTPAACLALGFLIPFFFLLGKSNRHLARYVNETLPFLLPFGAAWIIEMFKARSFVTKLIASILVVGSLSSAGYTIALNQSLAHEEDPRDQASDWIIQNIAPLTRIGVDNETPEFIHPGHLYMQFWKGKRYPAAAALPPDYDVATWDRTRQAWTGAPPVYWVDSHYIFEYPEKDPTTRALNAANLEALRKGYHPVMEFERQIHLGRKIYSFPKNAGFDWYHMFPHLTIYAKDQTR